MLFDHVDRQQLAPLGEVRRPSIADVFVAIMGSGSTESRPTNTGIPQSEFRNPKSNVTEIR
jgi:hypothetical protein